MQYAVLTTLSCLESKTIRRQKATQLHRTSQFTDAFNFGEKKNKTKKLNEKDFGGMYVMYHTALHLYLLAISVFKGYLKRISQAQTNVQMSWPEQAWLRMSVWPQEPQRSEHLSCSSYILLPLKTKVPKEILVSNSNKTALPLAKRM